jgi:hypothetical protein
MAGGTAMRRARGGRPSNRGDSAGGDDGVTVKMLPWYGRPRSAHSLPGTERTAATHGTGGIQGASGRGRVGKAWRSGRHPFRLTDFEPV